MAGVAYSEEPHTIAVNLLVSTPPDKGKGLEKVRHAYGKLRTIGGPMSLVSQTGSHFQTPMASRYLGLLGLSCGSSPPLASQ